MASKAKGRGAVNKPVTGTSALQSARGCETAASSATPPLTDQIEALMRSLTPAQRNRPWTMEELVARLHGRYNARPCAGSVGVALRRLGWTRIRDWSQGGGGRRVWKIHH